ncbi:DNA-invertase hin [Clostridium puniceum]|uniref:DNA-invertase hin n=1 Tax=Clostridium puniceum TaxID=29367 RepID=A0A1S8T1E0_9CLOT|nr:recombinase family protein [Clostridium puniceum]OOM71469.1 DNA-invertase hin [Clostridium puniceum]
MNKIAIYTRKSVYVENSESIETQITLCKEYFKSKGDCTIEVFEDEGFSGKNTNRPAFQRMMKEVKLGNFDVVAVYKVDRIARNIVDFVKIYDELEVLDVKLISITEGFDPSTPMGRMLMMILASFADMERANIAQRVKDNLLQVAKKGAFTGGKLPFGCTTEKRADGKSYLIISDIKMIQTAFDIYLETGNLYATHKKMIELGYSIATKLSMKGLLTNPSYCESTKEVSYYLKKNGYEIVGNPNGNGYMTYGCRSGEPIAIVGKHKPCIPATQFLKVQNLLDINKERAKKSSKDSKIHWLSTLVKCPVCGQNYILVNNGKKSYYVCTNRLQSAGKLKDIGEKCKNSAYVDVPKLENGVKKLVLGLNDYEKFIDSYKKERLQIKDSVKIQESINNNEKIINGLVDKILVLSTAASTPLLNKIEQLTEENSKLKLSLEIEKLAEIENEVAKGNKEYTYNNILEFSKLENPEEMKNKIRLIFKKIIYDPIEKKIKIEYL